MSEEDVPGCDSPGADATDNAETDLDNESQTVSGHPPEQQQEVGKRVEDKFTLEVLDELGNSFSGASTASRVQEGERWSGGHMSLSQFIHTTSSLLQTEEFSSQLRILFQKLDTRGSGYLSWSKLCSYLLTYLREKTQEERRGRQVLQDKPKFYRSSFSKSVTVLLFYLDSIKKYLLVSKDGVISLWTRDLTPISSVKLQSLLPAPLKFKGAPSYKPRSKVWVTSAVYYPNLNRLVLSTTSSDIYFISFLPPNTFIALYQLTELSSPAFSLAYHEEANMLLLLCGCADGSILVLRFLSPEQGLFSQEHTSKHNDCVKLSGRNLHRYHQFVVAAAYQVHNQWVRRIEYIPSFQSAMSCSHSTKVSLAITDLQRIKQPYLFSLPKGVSCFCYSHQLNLLLTGSVDRIIRVWCPYVPFKPTALLMGHDSFVVDVMVYCAKGVFLSIDTGGMVRIWDAIWNNCIQFVQLSFPLPANSWEFGPRTFFTGELSSSIRSTCANYVASFGLVPGKGDSELQGAGSSLKAPPCAALFASTFSLVLVGSEDSTIFTYDVYTGRRLYVIGSAHASEEITAMCIDQSGRRLITASRVGQAKGWDVNTGELLQTFVPVSQMETTALLPLAKNNVLYSAGWSKEIIAYKDRPEKVDIEQPRVWQNSKQHTEDILCADIAFPYLVTGSYDGMLILWNTETEKELYRARSGVKPRVEVPVKRAPSRQGDSLIEILQRPSSHKLSSRERGRISPSRLYHKPAPQENHAPVDALLFLKERVNLRTKSLPHLISSDGGYAVFWDIFHFSRPRQTIRLTRYPNETVLGLATDPLNTVLISGDTKGEIRVFSLNSIQSVNVSLSSQQIQTMDCIVSWRAHDSSIVSVEYIPGEGVVPFVLSASVDRNVRLWTLEGDYVGNFGTQFWDLKNPASYQHPKTPWGPKKSKVQIISRASSKESSRVSLLQSSPTVSRVASLAEDLDIVLPCSPLPIIRAPNLIAQSSKFFHSQPDPNLEPITLTVSEKELHIKNDFLLSSRDKLDIEERMKRRNDRRSRFRFIDIDKTERFPMLCSAHQALELTEIVSPDFQPISLPSISRERK